MDLQTWVHTRFIRGAGRDPIMKTVTESAWAGALDSPAGIFEVAAGQKLPPSPGSPKPLSSGACRSGLLGTCHSGERGKCGGKVGQRRLVGMARMRRTAPPYLPWGSSAGLSPLSQDPTTWSFPNPLPGPQALDLLPSQSLLQSLSSRP